METQPNGILNVDKPSGWTSHDVVGRVRRLTATRRVGHAGTLDPMATGVLLVCVGQATRLSDLLMSGQKVYRATARLGLETDTYDIEGHVVATTPVPALTEAGLEALLTSFIGEIAQRPPIFSAIKQQGIPSYVRARQGQDVELPLRRVTIHRIRILRWLSPDLTLEVTCNPGTYIRSLAHDLGQAAGCGATLAGLTRLQSGSFTLADAVSIERLSQAADAADLAQYLQPMQVALAGFACVRVTEPMIALLASGRALPCETAPETPRGYAAAPNGEVVALLRYEPARAEWQPTKVFVPALGRG